MKPLTMLVSAVSLTALVGCGTSVQETLKVNNSLRTNIGQGRKVVIMPFADYTEADDLESAFRRNLFVNENMMDKFRQNGFMFPVQEDVFRYLINRNIINVIGYTKNPTRSLDYELQKGWSDAMKGEMQKYAREARLATRYNPATDSPGTLGLDPAEVTQLGQNFAADYVVRGSIIQYKSRQDPSWAPWKKGVIPFVTGVTSQIAFGQASSDTYDNLGNIVTGGTIGAIYGHHSNNWPFNTKNKSILGITGHQAGNTIVWGAIGSGLGDVANNAGDIPQAVVQLRMYVQDAYNGEVVWANRVDVKVSPQSVLADYQYDSLFEEATEQAIKVLMDDFMYTLNPGVQAMVRQKEAEMNRRGPKR